MQNELRPCVFIWQGKWTSGLFHCLSEYREPHKKECETVALVEVDREDGGRIIRISPTKLHFLDTKKQMEKYFVGSGEQ